MNKILTLRIFFVFVVVFLAQFFIKENLNGFPYSSSIDMRYHQPYVLKSMANFDGVHYTNIAYEGYHQYDQAFFPLYPLLVSGIGAFFEGNHVLSGILISIFFLIVGAHFFYQLLREYYDKKIAYLSTLFLLLFPTSFFLQAIYSEGLFFALFSASLFYLHKKNFLVASLCASLASLTRIQGIFLIFPFFFYFYESKKNFFCNVKLIIRTKLPYMIAPFIGLFAYMLYLYQTTGDALYFFSTQPTFGANRSTHLILLPQVYYRYFKIFFTAAFNYQYFVSVLEFTFFTASFILSGLLGYVAWKHKKLFELGISLFSLSYLLLPTLTGTFSSIPRYSLFALAQYIFLAKIRNKKIGYVIATFFIIAQVILLSLFSRGYFIG